MDKFDSFNFNKYWGPNEYRSRVVFARGSDMQCVYCGETASTREHCPSRVFLSKPFPPNLPTVPACERCNNGFSSDELYTKAFIEVYKYHYLFNSEPRNSERREVKDAQQKFEEFVNSGKIHFDDRISRILIKLAICHITFELTTGFHTDSWDGIPEYVSYTFRPYMQADDIDSWDDFIPINDTIFPIIGSRVINQIYVLELKMLTEDNTEIYEPFAVMNWIDVQDNNYRYICWLDGKNINVKIVIDEFMYAEVVFKGK
ncbi:hypothetical protein B4133_0195 [Bacillus altitudinis]|uniref:hypothetical protein n=1 Tax=Bacillus altitudinis TaxID=293387 RepID=UPI0005970D5D|nr:hypothetical protein [Bacillus altitudinis]KIL27418.1 hypothetical protein B4133_0195 [Bacillus altitudinis]